MKGYSSYLTQKNYSPTTITSYQRQVHFFLQWCNQQKINPDTIDYKNALQYIKHLSEKPVKKRTLNAYLGAIKSYFTYLISEGVREDNPLVSMHIKGVVRSVHYKLLPTDILEAFYKEYVTDYRQESYRYYKAKRNKVCIGLMVYQGLGSEDLKLLKTTSLSLDKGTITIPKRKKSNARILELKPWQVFELMEYLGSIRPFFVEQSKNPDNQLLLTNNHRITYITNIVKKLKEQHPKLDNYFQIRASVIVNWLKTHNLREVQYMAGHRYISSTERYLTQDLEDLKQVISKCHPLQ